MFGHKKIQYWRLVLPNGESSMTTLKIAENYDDPKRNRKATLKIG